MSARRLWLRRTVAYAVDIVLLFLVLTPVGFAVGWLLDLPPATTGPEVWRTILWTYSLPVWIYFTIADRAASGATIGKRWLGVRVRDALGRRISLPRSLVRTAIKLLPWELTHVAAFALSTDLSDFGAMQIAGTSAATLLAVVYLTTAAATNGRRSVHDFVVDTAVVPDDTTRRTPG